MWGVISAGLIRGLMEMSIGIECYFASQYISQTDFHFRPWAKKVLPVAWELLGLYFILYAWLHKGGNTSNFFVLFGYVIVILLLAQRKEFFLRFLSWKNWQFIAPTAYMLFLTHVIWQKLVYKYVPYKQYPQWAVCLGLLLFCSIFGWFWYQAYKHYFAKLKKALFLPR
jgi:peptidoglycan/LPS O-acetylase OafA/YrhL